ncbi:hypothetical protein HYH03_005897 [Edaphochlamys debaryana]|uniref:GH10 domain-containing protein n=1 Tax=Edaphochlamys debaryana TaxID=47281 RepID=A0A835Y6G7_9CHLO|nr:hypothetical protein HYH03_005897 [Edaphochlamys debaryana]|eukprot:KAG2495967.1 hypothetical protein HYH03_005897 [Edaphochlamys debaryana]
MVALVKQMKAAGVPVDCIGVQAYINPRGPATPAFMKKRLDALAALNLTLLLGSEAEQAAAWDRYLRFWFSYPQIKGILMWGFWDAAHWIRNGGMYYANTTAKASATTVGNLWARTWTSAAAVQSPQLSPRGVWPPTGVAWRGFYGRYAYNVTLGPGGAGTGAGGAGAGGAAARWVAGSVRLPAGGAGARQTVTIAV